MEIALLPLDSRPCTRIFPMQLAKSCGIKLETPPLDVIDYFHTPGNFEKTKKWLEEIAAKTDVLLLSVDQLVYGGLLASRTMNVDEKTAIKRIGFIQELKQKNPGLQIHLFSVIMRTTISTLKAEDQIWWKKMAEYANLFGQSITTPQTKAKQEQLEKEIPTSILRTFLKARKRNHSINCEALQLVKEGIATEVVFLQEDSTPNGMHKVEQQILLKKAAEANIQQRVFLHCGTDEISTALMGRIIAKSVGKYPSVGIEWLDPNYRSFTARYEDRPFVENLELYCETCSIIPEVPEKSDVVLLIYSTQKEQQDLCISPADCECEYSSEELDSFVSRVSHWLSKGKKVALLDVYYANGGETRFAKKLIEAGLMKKLSAYSAWNTASNALGTILGQICVLPIVDKNENQLFLLERLMDDLLYQAVLRQKLNVWLKTLGEDCWNIRNVNAVNMKLQNLLQENELYKTILGNEKVTCKIELYWPRTFEALVTVIPQEVSKL